MARPVKDGVDYFPLDCGFYRDAKLRLLRREFGDRGFYLFFRLMNDAYEKHGYYMNADDDSLSLIGDECGYKDEFVHEVIKGCLKRSLFDEYVYETYRVLTSHGIQKQFVTIAAKRSRIVMIDEYLLLTELDAEDIVSSTLNKIYIKHLGSDELKKWDPKQGNPPAPEFSERKLGLSERKPPLSENQPPKEKEKEKVINNKEEEHEIPPENADFAKVMTFYLDRINPTPSPISTSALELYTRQMGPDAVIYAMQIALDQKVTKWSYIRAILQDWSKAGVKSMDDVRRIIREREESRNWRGDGNNGAANTRRNPSGGNFAGNAQESNPGWGNLPKVKKL